MWSIRSSCKIKHTLSRFTIDPSDCKIRYTTCIINRFCVRRINMFSYLSLIVSNLKLRLFYWGVRLIDKTCRVEYVHVCVCMCLFCLLLCARAWYELHTVYECTSELFTCVYYFLCCLYHSVHHLTIQFYPLPKLSFYKCMSTCWFDISQTKTQR